jgi:hypothetical protein
MSAFFSWTLNRCLLAALCCLPILVVSCDPGQRGDLVVKSHETYVLAQIRQCERLRDRTVTAIALQPLNGEALWEATSVSSSDARAFIVGVAPPGFGETIPLTTTLDPGVTYGLTVRLSDGSFLQNGFRPDQLRSDQWRNWDNSALRDGDLTKPLRC